MTIDDIYEAARARKLLVSRRQFSREFLGRAPNYAADRGLDRCSAGALLNLYRRLGEARQTDLQAAAFARLLDAETRERAAEAAQP
jgi:hypothetical protein